VAALELMHEGDCSPPLTRQMQTLLPVAMEVVRVELIQSENLRLVSWLHPPADTHHATLHLRAVLKALHDPWLPPLSGSLPPLPQIPLCADVAPLQEVRRD